MPNNCPTRLLFEFELSIASPKAFCHLEDSQRLECGKELNHPSPWRCPSCRGCRFGGVLCRVRPRGTCVGHKQQYPLHPEGFAHQQTCATSRQHFRLHWRKDLLRKSGRKLCFIHCGFPPGIIIFESFQRSGILSELHPARQRRPWVRVLERGNGR